MDFSIAPDGFSGASDADGLFGGSNERRDALHASGIVAEAIFARREFLPNNY
jgi:hypothetical protein